MITADLFHFELKKTFWSDSADKLTNVGGDVIGILSEQNKRE